jgi:gamma-glutamyltranspeptidase / glutathione hydrolase
MTVARSHGPAPPESGIVATAHPAATRAGHQALADGGNAIDAAVAAAWALCVCEPSGSGLGGQTVALVRSHGRTLALDGNSCAPSQVSTQTVSRTQQRRGYRATTVPTTPATLSYLHRRYGRLGAGRVIAPAIELATNGYTVGKLHHKQLRWCQAQLAGGTAATHFLRDGQPYREGEVFSQPALAKCLRRLESEGVEDFYRGAIAQAIDRDMRRYGGLLTLDDLYRVRTPVEREPLAGFYRDHLVLTLPAPGGGPQLLDALQTLERGNDADWCEEPDSWYQSLALAIRGAFEYREHEHRRPQAAVMLSGGVPGERGGETTHLCTADSEGNTVTLTQSIQSLFGAKVANSEFGFLYNNYLTTCPRRSHAHRLRGGGLARSNAAPTVVLSTDGREKVLALGAAGSRRIISSMVHVLSGVIDLGLDLPAAVGHARIHPRLRGTVLLERPAATPELVARLSEELGEVRLRARHSYVMGAVQALQITPEGVAAAADPRREGTTQ